MSVADNQFEEPLVELRQKIAELEGYPDETRPTAEIDKLRKVLDRQTREVFDNLSNWQQVLVARHNDRPFTLDYVERLTTDWMEIHGDRRFGDDPAIVTGFATFRGRSVAIAGHQKGRTTKSRITRNFGQPRPEGYRKALRLFELAEKFGLPVLTFVDTPGAYPGLGAEERGQAEAIARNLIEMADLAVPIVVTVTGEGGSGGALALGVGNRVHMLQYSIYSVISPEGCAAILWKDQNKRAEAADALKLTAAEIAELGLVDRLIPEPLGGAHTDPATACGRVGDAIEEALDDLSTMSAEALREDRRRKFRRMGVIQGSLDP